MTCITVNSGTVQACGGIEVVAKKRVVRAAKLTGGDAKTEAVETRSSRSRVFVLKLSEDGSAKRRRAGYVQSGGAKELLGTR